MYRQIQGECALLRQQWQARQAIHNPHRRHADRDARGVDRPIPPADYGRIAAELERLEAERLRKVGYTGSAKRPGE